MKKTSGSGSSGAVEQTVVASTATAGTEVSAGAPTGTSGSGAGTGATSSTLTAAGKPVVGLRLSLQSMLAGIQTMLPADSSIPTQAAAPLTVAGMEGELEADLALYSAVDQLVTQLAQARTTLRGGTPGMKAYLKEVTAALRVFYGASSPSLTHFGIKPAKAAKKLSSVQLVARTAKAEETRSIRHTQSKAKKATQLFQGQVAVSTQVSTLGSAAQAPGGSTATQSSGSSLAIASPPGSPAGVKQS
jgi:hypothetical protein